MENVLESIIDYSELGLNSSDPKHWEAALKDIRAIAKKAKTSEEIEANAKYL